MRRFLAVLLLSGAASAANAEERWFQACGPVYPVRLEGNACTTERSRVGFGGVNPATGVEWCCVSQSFSKEDYCPRLFRSFNEAAARGMKKAQSLYALLKSTCPKELAEVAQAAGQSLPATGGAPRASRMFGEALSQSADSLEQRAAGLRSSSGFSAADMGEILRFGIAIASTAATMYPVRSMRIDPGRSAGSSAGGRRSSPPTDGGNWQPGRSGISGTTR